MTVAGLLSGVLDPYGAGAALTRIARRGSLEQAGRPRPAPLAPQSEPPQDRVELSPEALAVQQQPPGPAENSPETAKDKPGRSDRDRDDAKTRQVDKLKQRDTEVRQHEQAHLAAAGPYARGGPTFEYQTGPDGKRYAVGGEVQIDTSPVEGDPQATIQKMQAVRAAALAPAEPSAQDRSVAAKAAAEIQKARAESNSPDSQGPQAAQAADKNRTARRVNDTYGPNGARATGDSLQQDVHALQIDVYA